MCVVSLEGTVKRMTPAELKSIRAALGWSQQRLAEELGVQRNTVNRWEMGTRKISRMAEKMLAFLRKRP